MKDSKNHAVCAKCHLTGEASGQDCTIMSSAVKGLQSSIVRARTLRNLSATLDCKLTDVVVLIDRVLAYFSILGCETLPFDALLSPAYIWVTNELDDAV